MKNAAKQPNATKLPKLGESSAPMPDSAIALNSVGNDVPENNTLDQSPRKPRLMNTLLAKLKERPKASPSSADQVVDQSSHVEMDFGHDGFELASDFGDGSVDMSDADSSHRPSHDEVWLGETQASDSTTRSMTFTYSPGSTPLPPYTIRRGVGMGGFGEVYFALSDAGKEVALKRIQRNLEIELRGVSQCLNLKHPNLVALFDICRDSKDESWVVMEYVAGLNLRQILDESPEGLSISEANRWMQGIGAGVHHLHCAGLVHRDLKPGNIFDDLGQVKVGDYGLSKFISTSHRGGHTESVGTFHYMAPEIGRGQYGREIDIYALGVLLFELLTGRVPFDGESCHEIIVKHLTATPDLSGIADPYRSTIAQCLEKDPSKRFSSVAEMLTSLENNGSASWEQQGSEPTNGHSVLGAALLESEPIEAILVASPVDVGNTPKDGQQKDQDALFDEPVARAVQTSWHDFTRWFTGNGYLAGPYEKTALGLVVGILFFVNVGWLVPLLTLIACGYVPYYVIWKMVVQSKRQPKYAEAQRLAVQYAPQRRVVSPVAWASGVRNELRAKPRLNRLAELNTSWIAATLSAIGLAGAAGAIRLYNEPVPAQSIATYVWLAIIVLGASFNILSLGKLWECDDGEPLARRLALAGVGAAIGYLAFVAGEFLMIPLDGVLVRDLDSTSLSPSLYPEGNPTVSAFVTHFALLFAVLRWWKPVDPLRRKRLSLWSVAVAVFVGWAVHQFIPIPGAIGIMAAGGIAITVQLSAPWVNRKAIRHGSPQNQPADGNIVGVTAGGTSNV